MNSNADSLSSLQGPYTFEPNRGVMIGMIKSKNYIECIKFIFCLIPSGFIGGKTIADTSLSLHSILHCALALLVELKTNARRWSAFILILGDSLLQNLWIWNIQNIFKSAYVKCLRSSTSRRLEFSTAPTKSRISVREIKFRAGES